MCLNGFLAYGVVLDLDSRYCYIYFMLVMDFISVTAKVYSTTEVVQDYNPISSPPLGSHDLLI